MQDKLPENMCADGAAHKHAHSCSVPHGPCHPQAVVFGCELVLPLKSSAVIYNARRRLALTSLLSHSEPCLLALTNTTRDKTELGGEKLPTEISSLIS